MADALTILDIPSNGSKITSANEINTEAKPGILPGWLSFYSDIVGNIRNYQEALEKQNYADSYKFNLVISKRIADYLNNLSDDSDSIKKEFKEKVRNILKEATDSNIKTIKESIDSSFFGKDKKKDSEVISTIEKAIEKYRNEIQKILESRLSNISSLLNTIRKKALEKADESFNSKRLAALDVENKVVDETINQVNLQISSRDKEINTSVLDFSTQLVDKVFSVFKENLDKINSSILDASNKITTSALGNSTANLNNNRELNKNDTISDTDKKTKEIKDEISKKAAVKSSEILNKSQSSLKIGLKIASAAILAFIKRTLMFVFFYRIRQITRTLFKFVFFDVWHILGTIRFRIVNAFKTLYSFAKKVHDKFAKNSIFKFVYDSLVAFFKTYAGAYVLGEFFGTLWWIIKKKLNVETFGELKDIATDKISNLADTISEKIKNMPTFSEILDAFRNSKVYKAASTIASTLEWMYNTIKPTFEKYILPTIVGFGYLLSLFTENISIDDIRSYFKVKGGVLAGFSYLSKSTKFLKAKGGIAALVAGAAIVGANVIFKNNLSDRAAHHIRELNKVEKESVDISGKDIFGSDITDVGFFETTAGIVERLTKGKKQFNASAEILVNSFDSLAEASDLCKNHIQFLNGYVRNISKEDDNYVLPSLPRELIDIVLRGVKNKSELERIYNISDPIEQTRILLDVISQKKEYLKNKVSEFKKLVEENNLDDSSFKESLSNFNFKYSGSYLEHVNKVENSGTTKEEYNRKITNENAILDIIEQNAKNPVEITAMVPLDEFSKTILGKERFSAPVSNYDLNSITSKYDHDWSRFSLAQQVYIAEHSSIPEVKAMLPELQEKRRKEIEQRANQIVERFKIDPLQEVIDLRFLRFKETLENIWTLVSSNVMLDLTNSLKGIQEDNINNSLIVKFTDTFERISSNKYINALEKIEAKEITSKNFSEKALEFTEHTLIDSLISVKNYFKDSEDIMKAFDSSFSDIEQYTKDVLSKNSERINSIVDEKVNQFVSIINEIKKRLSDKSNKEEK